MTVHLVTFSDSQMSRAAELCHDSARANGVDQWWYYTSEIVRNWPIAQEHPNVFRQPEDSRRAWSWWAFKPLIISSVLEQRADNDVIVYADAGVEFINNVSHII